MSATTTTTAENNEQVYLILNYVTLVIVVVSVFYWLFRKRAPVPREGKRPVLEVKRLFVYPIKSCCGVEVKEVFVDKRGLWRDRRWMIIDENNTFVTIRQKPKMWQIKPKINEETGEVTVTFNNNNSNNSNSKSDLSSSESKLFDKPLLLPEYKRKTADQFEEGKGLIWGDPIDVAIVKDPFVNQWFSTALNTPNLRLCCVLTEQKHTRRIGKAFDVSRGKMWLGLNDMCPINMISKGSLALLNETLQSRNVDFIAQIERFRTNIFIGCVNEEEEEYSEPHVEDFWVSVGIGEVSFSRTHATSRCVMPTIDPVTSVHTPKYEPIRTLRTYRNNLFPKNPSEPGVFFGQHFTQDSFGKVEVGDRINVLRTGRSNIATNGNYTRHIDHLCTIL